MHDNRAQDQIQHPGRRNQFADEIDLAQLARLFWRRRWFILAVTLSCAVISVTVVLRLPDQYRATALLEPASEAPGDALSRFAGQLGAVATLAAATLGSGGDADRTTAAMEILKSWDYQERFIRANKLEVPLLAAKGWDQEKEELIIDRSIYDPSTQTWRGKPLQRKGGGPSGWRLHEKFADRLSVSRSAKTGLVSVSIEHYSPQLAREWVNKLVAELNREMREHDRSETSRSVEYLQKELRSTELVEMRPVFSALIEEQTRKLMLADISEEYVFRTISPAKEPEEKSGPHRALIVLVSTALGGILACVLCLVWSAASGRAAE